MGDTMMPITLYSILKNVIKSLIYKLRLRAFTFYYDVTPLIAILALYIAYLVKFYIHRWRMIRGYSGPRYMLELYLNESSNAKAMYTIRSLMLLTNISLK